MANVCTLLLDDIAIAYHPYDVPNFISALFQESDHTEITDGKTGYTRIGYRAERETVLKRLDLMGCTESVAYGRFNDWQNVMYRKYDERLRFGKSVDKSTRDFLLKFDWEKWKESVARNLGRDKNSEDCENIGDRQMRRYGSDWLWFDGFQSLISLRAIIQGATHIQTITLDVNELLVRRKKNFNFCPEHKRIISEQGQPTGPAIILVGGESDIAILKAFFQRFFPDLEGFVKIFDHSEFSMENGAENLLKILKAFASTRVPTQIVAVFDNDTAGLTAYQRSKSIDLPANITCIHLPDIELGRSYPTTGPLGRQNADINGKACSIELYLGRRALTSDSALRTVQWTSYDKNTETYQGEIEEKEAIREAFLLEMRLRNDLKEADYEEMMLVWHKIFKACKKSAGKAQKNSMVRPFDIQIYTDYLYLYPEIQTLI